MKLLIVDDEVIIREGLRQVIDWQELDIRVIGTAASAEEAWSISSSVNDRTSFLRIFI